MAPEHCVDAERVQTGDQRDLGVIGARGVLRTKVEERDHHVRIARARSLDVRFDPIGVDEVQEVRPALERQRTVGAVRVRQERDDDPVALDQQRRVALLATSRRADMFDAGTIEDPEGPSDAGRSVIGSVIVRGDEHIKADLPQRVGERVGRVEARITAVPDRRPR